MQADVLPFGPVAPDPPAIPADPPITVDAKRLAKLLDIGLRTVRSFDAAGKLPKPVRIGARVLWIVDEIRAWLAAGTPDRATWERIRSARR